MHGWRGGGGVVAWFPTWVKKGSCKKESAKQKNNPKRLKLLSTRLLPTASVGQGWRVKDLDWSPRLGQFYQRLERGSHTGGKEPSKDKWSAVQTQRWQSTTVTHGDCLGDLLCLGREGFYLKNLCILKDMITANQRICNILAADTWVGLSVSLKQICPSSPWDSGSWTQSGFCWPSYSRSRSWCTGGAITRYWIHNN